MADQGPGGNAPTAEAVWIDVPFFCLGADEFYGSSAVVNDVPVFHVLPEERVVAADDGVAGLAVGFEGGKSVFFDLILVTIAEASTVEPDVDGSRSIGFQTRPEIEDVALVFCVIFDVALGCGGCGVTIGDHGEE